MDKNDYLVFASLTYGELLKKSQKRLLISLIVTAGLLILIGIIASIFLFDRVIDKILFLNLFLILGIILASISVFKLESDKKNKALINQSISDAVLIRASSRVLHANWLGAVKISVHFYYGQKKKRIFSKRHLRLSEDFIGRDVDILYSPQMNSVLLFEKP